MTPEDRSHRAKLIVCFATVYLVWGSTYLVASIGVHALPPLLFGGIRFVCAGILLGPDGARARSPLRARRGRMASHVRRVAGQRGDCQWRDQHRHAARRVQPDSHPQCLGRVVDRAARDARAARPCARPPDAHRAHHRLCRHDAHHLAARQDRGQPLRLPDADPRRRLQLVGRHGVHPQRALEARRAVVHRRFRCC